MIIYARHSVNRKPEYQITTLIEEKVQEKLVKKIPYSKVAQTHVKQLKSSYEKLSKCNAPFKIAPVKMDGSTAVFPFVEGVSLEEEFINGLIDHHQEKVISVLDQVTSLVSNMPSRDVDLKRHKDFNLVFGRTFSLESSIEPGVLDLNLDNIIRSKKNLHLIDYEFTFDFPLPKALILGRMLYNLFAYKTASILHAIASDKFAVVEVGPGILVPQFIYQHSQFRILLEPENLRKILQAEYNFQAYVTGKTSTVPTVFKRPVVHKRRLFLRTMDRVDGLVDDLARTQKELNALRVEQAQLLSELSALKGSRIYKMYSASKKARKRFR